MLDSASDTLLPAPKLDEHIAAWHNNPAPGICVVVARERRCRLLVRIDETQNLKVELQHDHRKCTKRLLLGKRPSGANRLPATKGKILARGAADAECLLSRLGIHGTEPLSVEYILGRFVRPDISIMVTQIARRKDVVALPERHLSLTVVVQWQGDVLRAVAGHEDVGVHPQRFGPQALQQRLCYESWYIDGAVRLLGLLELFHDARQDCWVGGGLQDFEDHPACGRDGVGGQAEDETEIKRGGTTTIQIPVLVVDLSG